MTREAQQGRGEIQTIVRLGYDSHRYTCTCQHPDRMRGNAEKAPVISAWIGKARIEVPVVRGKNMEIILYEFGGFTRT